MGELTAEQLTYLRDLQKGPVLLEHFHLWHGSPRDEDEYITKRERGRGLLSGTSNVPLAFFGHTHVQGGFFLTGGKVGYIPPPHEESAGAGSGAGTSDLTLSG